MVVPCYLLIPDNGKKKYPVVITLQGHSTGFHNSINVAKYPGDEEDLPRVAFAIQAVENGYAALAIEQRAMGETKPQKEKRNWGKMCSFTAQVAFSLGRTLIGERVWDVSKAIDVYHRVEKQIIIRGAICTKKNIGIKSRIILIKSIQPKLKTLKKPHL